MKPHEGKHETPLLISKIDWRTAAGHEPLSLTYGKMCSSQSGLLVDNFPMVSHRVEKLIKVVIPDSWVIRACSLIPCGTLYNLYNAYHMVQKKIAK